MIACSAKSTGGTEKRNLNCVLVEIMSSLFLHACCSQQQSGFDMPNNFL